MVELEVILITAVQIGIRWLPASKTTSKVFEYTRKCFLGVLSSNFMRCSFYSMEDVWLSKTLKAKADWTEEKDFFVKLLTWILSTICLQTLYSIHNILFSILTDFNYLVPMLIGSRSHNRSTHNQFSFAYLQGYFKKQCEFNMYETAKNKTMNSLWSNFWIFH